jgi:hypothetical protein
MTFHQRWGLALIIISAVSLRVTAWAVLPLILGCGLFLYEPKKKWWMRDYE